MIGFADIGEQDIISAGLEMMDKFAIEAAEAFVKIGYPLDAQADKVSEILKAAQATSITVSTNEKHDANKEGELEKTEEFGQKILELCIEVGGTITGEHGVGVEKLDSMCVQFTAPELDTFHGIKKVFDQQELLNPGKAIPTLNRCAELGQMHVHNNQLPFPELERF
jgi:hypothetical protein